MGDVTRRRFWEMLGCVEDPVIGNRSRDVKYPVVTKADILLVCSNSLHVALDCMRAKDICPYYTISSPHYIVLGVVHGYRYGMGALPMARLEKRTAKYERWLKQWKDEQIRSGQAAGKELRCVPYERQADRIPMIPFASMEEKEWFHSRFCKRYAGDPRM